MKRPLIAALGAVIAAAATPCLAAPESPPPATAANPAPVPYGDWILRCGASPDGAARACEIDSVITLEGQKQPVAQVAFGRPIKAAAKPAEKAGEKSAKDAAAGEATTRLIIIVPVNVTIAPGIEVVADADKPHLTFPLKTCVPAACMAQIELTGEQLQAFRNRTQPGQIIFTDPGGRAVPIPLSFKGLDQALDALAKQ